jgi:hypothetical protein
VVSGTLVGLGGIGASLGEARIRIKARQKKADGLRDIGFVAACVSREFRDTDGGSFAIDKHPQNIGLRWD